MVRVRDRISAPDPALHVFVSYLPFVPFVSLASVPSGPNHRLPRSSTIQQANTTTHDEGGQSSRLVIKSTITQYTIYQSKTTTHSVYNIYMSMKSISRHRQRHRLHTKTQTKDIYKMHTKDKGKMQETKCRDKRHRQTTWRKRHRQTTDMDTKRHRHTCKDKKTWKKRHLVNILF
jgi:hypothetical protein